MEIKCGLWVKTSKNDVKYQNGKINIEGKDYWVNIFRNDKKGNEKRPDYNLILKSVETNKVSSLPGDEMF